MRLTCPNCDAQYEVPDEVIPPEGRDVQCSNCGNTWFHAHPDHPERAAGQFDDEFDDDEFEDDAFEEGYPEDDDEPAPEPRPQRRSGPGVAGILREEAEREARLRAAEAGTLESQPDLGLDSHADQEPARRAREARDRMSRIRGEAPAPAVPPTDPGTRRGLLPDIEEINSTLRAAGDGGPGTGVSTIRSEPAAARPPAKGSFRRGFAVAVIVAVALGLIYGNARRIAEAVPQADPMLSAYVALVDQARVWLDAKAGALKPQ